MIDDSFDIAYMPLKPNTVDQLLDPGQVVPLRLDQVDHRTAPDMPQGHYAIFGFPISLVRERLTVMSFHGVLHKGPVTGVTHLHDEKLHIMIRKNAVTSTDTGERFELPATKGMSGCPIWRLSQEHAPDVDSWSPDDAKLVGIFTGQYREANLLKGTVWRAVFEAIRREHAALRSSMNLLLD